MSIATAIDNLSARVQAAYAALELKGATMPEIRNTGNLPAVVGTIPSGGLKYGADGGTFLGDVDANGVLQAPSSGEYDLVFTGVKDLSPNILEKKFMNNPTVKSATFPDLENVTGNLGAYQAFAGSSLRSFSAPKLSALDNQSGFSEVMSQCTSLTSINLESLKSVNGTYAGNMMCYGCTSLREANLSSLLSARGDHALNRAFYGCTSLSSVDLRNLVDAYNGAALYEAFYGCTSLTSANMPNLTSVGYQTMYQAFYGCTSLREMDLGGLSTVANDQALIGAFRNCTSLSSANLSSLRSASGSYCFTNLFNGCSSLQSLSFDNLSSVGGYNFASDMCKDCTGLTSVSFPSLETINGNQYNSFQGAFSGCSSLVSVYFKALPALGYTEFANCTSLSVVNFGNELTAVTNLPGTGVFQNVPSTCKIVVPDALFATWPTATNWSALNVQYVRYSDYMSTKVFLTDNTVEYYPAVDGVLSDAYKQNTSVRKVEVGEDVTSIGSHAFGACTGLTSVTIPNSVSSIGDSAFSLCTGLTSITIPDGVTSIGSHAFSTCTGLTSITIPDGVTDIYGSAFNSCTGLSSITIPNNVANIWKEAFAGCTKLTSVVIPDSVKHIGEGAFYNTGGNVEEFSKISIPSLSSMATKVFYQSTWSEIEFPDDFSITDVPYQTFYQAGLSSWHVPKTITKIWNRVFCFCSNLKDLYFSDESEGVRFDRSGGVNEWIGCTQLSGIHIDTPAGLEGICRWYFNNGGIQSPFRGYNAGNVKLIIGGEEATDIRWPDSLSVANTYCFAYMANSHWKITFGPQFTSLGNQQFDNCTGLYQVDFEGSPSSFQQYGFNSCTSLSAINLSNCTSVPTLNTVNCFASVTANVIIPDSLYDTWTTASNWSALTNITYVRASQWQG